MIMPNSCLAKFGNSARKPTVVGSPKAAIEINAPTDEKLLLFQLLKRIYLVSSLIPSIGFDCFVWQLFLAIVRFVVGANGSKTQHHILSCFGLAIEPLNKTKWLPVSEINTAKRMLGQAHKSGPSHARVKVKV